MRNLFDFATKELSQDAFLMWLFENYDCENRFVRQCAYGLLNEFSGLDMKDGEIESLLTYSQYPCKPCKSEVKGQKRGKMDVLIRFEYKGEVYLTVIEDKTLSSQHDNQLRRYDDTLYHADTIKAFGVTKEHISRIFYKTDIEEELDKRACREAEWKAYFLEDIYDLLNRIFPDGSDTGSDILNDYIAYVASQRKKTLELPDTPMNEWKRISLRTFFYLKILGESTDTRINRESLIDSKYYYYNEFTLRYYIPGTSYRICLGVITREGSDRASVSCYISSFPHQEDPLNKTDEKRCPTKTEQAVIKTFLEKCDGFSKINSKGAKNYLHFGNIKKNAKVLRYDNGPEKLAASIREIMTKFLDVCSEISL